MPTSMSVASVAVALLALLAVASAECDGLECDAEDAHMVQVFGRRESDSVSRLKDPAFSQLVPNVAWEGIETANFNKTCSIFCNHIKHPSVRAGS